MRLCVHPCAREVGWATHTVGALMACLQQSISVGAPDGTMIQNETAHCEKQEESGQYKATQDTNLIEQNKIWIMKALKV